MSASSSDGPSGGSLDEPRGRIAPLDDRPWRPEQIVMQMMTGAYTYGTVLAFHELRLMNHGGEDSWNVWRLFDEDDTEIDAVNLEAFRSATELMDYLETLRD